MLVDRIELVWRHSTKLYQPDGKRFGSLLLRCEVSRHRAGPQLRVEHQFFPGRHRAPGRALGTRPRFDVL